MWRFLILYKLRYKNKCHKFLWFFKIWIKKSNEKFYKVLSYSQELQILRPNATSQLLSVSQMWRFLVQLKFFEELQDLVIQNLYEKLE